MAAHPFLFSDQKKYRLLRHVSFWLLWWVSMGILYSFVAASGFEDYKRHLPVTFSESLVYLSVHILLSYSLMYFVVPRYLLRQRYLAAIGWVILLFTAAAAFSAFLSLTIIQKIYVWLDAPRPKGAIKNIAVSFHQSMMAGFRGGITVAGIATAIKLVKHWYVKEQNNLQLQKENAENQLQLLKAQVHPHFLFNTLNNIYAHTHQKAPEAGAMLTDLSALLRYILYEGNKPLVLLSTELKLIEEYIRLEKIRYGNKLDIQIHFPEHTDQYVIAPLLLLPLVENSFKHGTSEVLEQPWISMTVLIDKDEWLQIKLMNARSPVARRDKDHGIGLQNVKKRLSLLYGAHQDMIITEDEEVFVVNLRLKLQKANTSVVKNNLQHA